MSAEESVHRVLVVIMYPSVVKYLTRAEFVMEMILAAMLAKILVLIALGNFWMLAEFAEETTNLAQAVMAL